MAHSVRVAVLLGVAFAVAPAVASAQSAGPQPVRYKLREEATFQRGCFPPCLCPIMESARVRGTLELTPAGFDGLFDVHDVGVVRWRVPLSGQDLHVAGSGTYRIGGEFALMNQLSLDLQVGGDPMQSFDSGLVAGGSRFPRIDLPISVHGAVCFDTLIDVHAEPVVRLQPPTPTWPGSLSPARSATTSSEATWAPCSPRAATSPPPRWSAWGMT